MYSYIYVVKKVRRGHLCHQLSIRPLLYLHIGFSSLLRCQMQGQLALLVHVADANVFGEQELQRSKIKD